MEGPTPVSAIIHSSTMVTAGIIFTIKIKCILSLIAWGTPILIVISVTTLILSSISTLFVFDIKNFLANSTISQLSIMFLIIYINIIYIPIVYFCAHAFYKSVLFILFGIAIFIQGNTQDSRILGLSHNKKALFFCIYISPLLAFLGMPTSFLLIGKIQLITSISEGYSGINIICLTSVLYIFLINILAIISLIFKIFNSSINNTENSNKLWHNVYQS